MAGISKHSIRFRESEDFVPASTLKIATAFAAMETLGPDFRFTTSFYFDRKSASLYIKGGGDPMLVSESVAGIAKILSRQLKMLHIAEIENLFLDDGAFSVPAPPPGSELSDNPYDTQNSALAVNFNALPIVVGTDGTIVSGEPQTPTLPIMADIATQFPPGHYRVNIYAYPQLRAAGDPAVRYTAELFTAKLHDENIAIRRWRRGAVPPGTPMLYSYQGEKNLLQILKPCLKYSNNFIANQIFLTVGARISGLPATWDKGQRSMADFLARKMPDYSGSIRIFDGAGLSRDNRISPAAMVALLHHFQPYSFLLPEIRNRLIKSGTLKGVYCYAGYFKDNGALVPFALFLNQEKNSRDEAVSRLENLTRQMQRTPLTGRN